MPIKKDESKPKTKPTKPVKRLVKMKSKALSPVHVPGIGEVPVNGEINVPEERARELEKGLFERVKGG